MVLREVFAAAEVKELKDLIWDWLEGFGSKRRVLRTEPLTWTTADKRWPRDNQSDTGSTGIVCVRGAGQTAAAWKVRGSSVAWLWATLSPFKHATQVVQSVFARHWDVEPKELLTSMEPRQRIFS